ncbi:SO2B1 protein, partial [Picathartes gymnocephalus]|nr:SO2B1 protein [Picathartes gymnocephalus]
QFFVLCHGLLQLSQLLVSGYLKSSISTIERRYGLSSQTSGLLASFNEVGNTLLIVFVSYLGSRVHRPRLIGCGALLVSLAGFLMSLPHFIAGPYEYDQSVASTFSNTTDLCQPGAWANLSDASCTPHASRENHEVLLVMFMAQALLGIGGVPIQPFGISYIDDFASERNSPLYLGILFSVTVIGPGVAFMLGSAMLRFYVDIDKVSAAEVQLTNKDPRWVGAWWLGFLVAASLVALSALPYFFFPREMPREVGGVLHTHTHTPQSATGTGTSFPVVLLRNLRHPVYLLVVLAQVNISAMVAGLATFMGKFLERQFSLTASLANMIIGAVNIPGAMVGIVVGGAILKRFQMSLRQCSALCVLGMLLCLLTALPLLFLGCPTQKVAGVTYWDRYHSSGPGTGSGGHSQGGHVPDTGTFLGCNTHCQCPEKVFNPICGSDGVEYTSPCSAGCRSVSIPTDSSVLNYTRCSCIPGPAGFARPGSCGTGCSHLFVPFVVLSCLAGILASISHTPSFMLILRSIQPEDKSFAVGIQFMLLRVLAWMPGPVLYGSAIDTACVLWERRCDQRAACRYYDNSLFRRR